MRVALDVTTAMMQGAGVGRYTRGLALGLGARADVLQLRPFYIAPAVTYPLAIESPPMAVGKGIRAWRLEMLARHLARRPARGPWDGADLYHAPDVVFPPVASMPVVMTVHDLSFIVHPRYHTRLNGGYLRLMTPIAARAARLIIADSEATKRDLIERVGVAERRIRVVYIGVDDAFARRPDDSAIDAARQHYGLTEPYVLSVGTQEPRKNLHGTLRAYRLLTQRLGDAPLLALVGGKGWGLDEAALAGDERRVRRLGYVPDADLAALYAGCAAFVYPSLYEGWGLPVAEALALGAPVVTSNLSSLPEVAGDAALLVDPHSPEEIAAGLERVLTDGELAGRLRAAGPAHADAFSSEAWIDGTLRVYREALES